MIQKKKLSATQKKSIENAARSWSTDNMEHLPSNNNCSFLTLRDLKNLGLLDSDIIDTIDNKEISNDLKIKIISRIGNNGKSILNYEVDSKNANECTYIGSSIYVDLPDGLTPVLYDEKMNSWRVPNINEEWYDYDRQEWANAVVLGKGKTKRPGEKVTVEGENPDALMMLVYVPRYEYKIKGEYGIHTDGTVGTQELPGEIEVKFINNTQLVADDGYILHPAFNFNGEKNGFWVGKFELSSIGTNLSSNNNLNCNQNGCTSSISNLRILPEISSLKYNDVSNFWYAIKSIENTSSFGLSNIDAHMIKNSEWGAVAYLSQSKYGKYGNKDYSGAYREIYQNKSALTGKSNGTPSQENQNPQCKYNDMTNLGQDSNGYKMGQCGPGASTTGTIYGVYDMSGGLSEYVMGVFGTSSGEIYSGSSTTNNSGFNGLINNDTPINNSTEIPNLIYYRIYTLIDINKACNGDICYGDALSEVKNWYKDYAQIVNTTGPWFLRGGSYSSTYYAGVFNFSSEDGASNAYNSTRIILINK